MISKKILGLVTFIISLLVGIFPILSDNLVYLSLWIGGVILILLIWIYELLKEWSNNLIMNLLTDEDFQNEFFMGFISERRSIQEITDDNIVVSKIFDKDDLVDFLKFYLYLLIKKSKILLFTSRFISSDELYKIIDSDVNGKNLSEIKYLQIYPLRVNWEMGEYMQDKDYDGKIKFKKGKVLFQPLTIRRIYGVINSGNCMPKM
jgi:hypothetical protein